MANMLFANNCNTTLSSSLTSGATSMSVTSATGFPSPTGVQYFYCTLADAATQTTIEIVKVTSVTGTTFAITRAQDGTSATAFAAGAVVSLRLVRASLNDFPKLDETNTFNADQSISGALTVSAGLVSTSTFTATPPSDGLVMDYATGFGRFSAFAGDGFQWYNAGVATTKLMQLSSSGAITTATWNGATVDVAYGGTGITTTPSNGQIPIGNGTKYTASTITSGSGISVTNGSGSITVANTQNTGPAFSAYLSTDQSIANATFVKVALNTKEFDTNSNFDNSTNYRFTPTVAGYYQINGSISCSSTGGAFETLALISIFKNGSEYKRGTQIPTPATGTIEVIVSSIVYFNGSTDYVELYGFSVCVSGNVFTGGSNVTYFNGAMIRTS